MSSYILCLRSIIRTPKVSPCVCPSNSRGTGDDYSHVLSGLVARSPPPKHILRIAIGPLQIEYCRNFIFKWNFPIHKLFERSNGAPWSKKDCS